MYNIGMLQDCLPASVYQLLLTDKVDTEKVNISDEDWHKARCYMLDLTSYGAAKCWKIDSVRDFTPEECSMILSCRAKESQYGISMEFITKDHKEHLCNPHIPCDNSEWELNKEYDINDLQLMYLEAGGSCGSNTIFRVIHKGSHPEVENNKKISNFKEWWKWTKEIWETKLNPIRHAQWDREGSHPGSKFFRDLILY